MSKKVKALIFDMDGLLFDTEEIYCAANLELAPDFGMKEYSKEYYFQYVGVSDEETHNAYYKDFAYLGKEKIDAFVRAGHIKVREMFQAGMAPLKPGVKELLAYLAEAEIPSIVASSNNREFIELLLEQSQISHHFVGTVSGEDVKRAKPDPEIVLKAIAELGFAAEECLMLEDSFNGVRASYSADVPVIMVPDLLAPTPEMEEKCVAILPSLHEVKDFLIK